MIFTTTLASTNTPYITITWEVNATAIVAFSGCVTAVTPAYQGRVTLNTFTGSVELKNLALKDNGTYRVSIITTGGSISKSGSTELQVLGEFSVVRSCK